jgi:hypothetical protein
MATPKPDNRHEDAEAAAWKEMLDGPVHQISDQLDARVLKAESKLIPAFGRKRRKLVGWPKGRRR